MSDLVEKQYRFLRAGEFIKEGDEWARNWNPEADDDDWSKTKNINRCVSGAGPNIYRRLVTVKHYRYLKVGEIIKVGDEWSHKENSPNDWIQTTNINGCVRESNNQIYRRLISESKPNEETNISDSTDRRETSTVSSSNQSNRDRHVTIDKSNYCWDGSVDLTKQHCISVSVEEV